jgi:V/A-type H+-transporting ATPase subunit C
VKTSWGTLAARARGLSTHLLADGPGRALERSDSLVELTHLLRDTPYARFLGAGEPGAAALERAVARSLAERMTLLARWAGPDAGLLRPIYVEQDARNVRDIVRGLVGGLAPEHSVASAVPTPLLGRRELEALAGAESPGSAAATLAVWGHPLGPALLEEARRRHPDPFRMEAALARAAAAEALRAARRGGRRLRAFVREEVDAGNAVHAVLLAGARTEGEVADLFVEGGSAVTREQFTRAASAPDRVEAAAILADATAGTTLSTPLRERPLTPAALADRILGARIDGLARRGRQEPLSAVPVLLFVLRLRREAQLVRRALWAVALSGGRGR